MAGYRAAVRYFPKPILASVSLQAGATFLTSVPTAVAVLVAWDVLRSGIHVQ